MRDFSARLIAHESEISPSGGKEVAVAFSVFEKLRPHLATLMGNGGYRALLMRSLALAVMEVPRLRTARVSADGTLEDNNQTESSAGCNELSKARVILLAHLIALLVAFIGERLTLQIVHEVWPKLAAKQLNFSIGDKENEKTKRRR